MKEIQRWYDKEPRVREIFLVLKSMQEHEQGKTTEVLYGVVVDYRQKFKNRDQLHSVGRDKLIGYYKSYQKRRWYDKDPLLNKATTFLSMMSAEEMDEVIETFLKALKSQGLADVYQQRKIDLLR